MDTRHTLLLARDKNCRRNCLNEHVLAILNDAPPYTVEVSKHNDIALFVEQKSDGYLDTSEALKEQRVKTDAS